MTLRSVVLWPGGSGGGLVIEMLDLEGVQCYDLSRMEREDTFLGLNNINDEEVHQPGTPRVCVRRSITNAFSTRSFFSPRFQSLTWTG